MGRSEVYPSRVICELRETPETLGEFARCHPSRMFRNLRPGAIIRDLDLRRPIYKQTAAYGHFGRDDLALPWERTDTAAALRREAFVGEAGGSEATASS